MLDAARDALSFVEGKSRIDLDRDRGLLLSVVQCVQIIGEAAGRVSAPRQRGLPGIPWPAIVGMRNRLVHAYYDIDHDQVWKTVTEDLPPLVEALKRALGEPQRSLFPAARYPRSSMDERPSDESAERCSPTWLAVLLATPAICILLTFVLPFLPQRSTSTVCHFPELDLMALVQHVRTHALARDGRLDVYALLRRELASGRLSEESIAEICRGPSWEEIEAGDYTNFPYHRRKGSFSPDADPPVPVLWEPRGTRKGGRLVAFSDGSVRLCDDAEAEEIFRNDPGQE